MESTKRLLWWMLAGSSGGINRGRIILLLRERPYNAHQMAGALGLDYKTVRHHIDVLLENNLLISRGEGYGRMFFLSPELETDFAVFEQIWAEIGKSQIKPVPDGKKQVMTGSEQPEATAQSDRAGGGNANPGRSQSEKGKDPQEKADSDGDA